MREAESWVNESKSQSVEEWKKDKLRVSCSFIIRLFDFSTL
jgi:hypothetical protein